MSKKQAKLDYAECRRGGEVTADILLNAAAHLNRQQVETMQGAYDRIGFFEKPHRAKIVKAQKKAGRQLKLCELMGVAHGE